MDPKLRRLLRSIARAVAPRPTHASTSEQRRRWDEQTRRTQAARAHRTKRTLP